MARLMGNKSSRPRSRSTCFTEQHADDEGQRKLAELDGVETLPAACGCRIDCLGDLVFSRSWERHAVCV